ncbi:MAG: prolipoprotein diacylglyceryl transferase [Gammaproteobacteria bacterium]|nr:prolipoprotein diacylglyceryl transferase [Gammaproteobacteria bacterium]MCP5135582.1 prolipoprotein diacylglyceryl transferase [Gammaproteobacteria bacterium]
MLILGLSLLLAPYLRWGFTTLVGERWQFFATIPTHKDDDGRWHGVNLTFYGLLSANAYVVALAIFILLCGSAGVSAPISLLTLALMLLVCVPASRYVAWLVERKWHSFTVGGAFFAGVVAAPAVIAIVNGAIGFGNMSAATPVPVLPTLAAMAIAYAYGEGLGRLSCISFGCCYGKPVDQAPDWVARHFQRWNFTFFGNTRKVAYAGGLQGVKLIPIQAITALTYTLIGLLSTWLYLRGMITAALFTALIVTQIWRFASEMLRADYRGDGRISAYQIMALVAIALTGIYALMAQESSTTFRVIDGLSALWNPAVILSLLAVWVLIFTYMGRSTITEATLQVRVRTDQVRMPATMAAPTPRPVNEVGSPSKPS